MDWFGIVIATGAMLLAGLLMPDAGFWRRTLVGCLIIVLLMAAGKHYGQREIHVHVTYDELMQGEPS